MDSILSFLVPIILVVLVLLVLAANVRVVPQSRAFVIERLGAFQGVWGVGLHFKIPFIERVAKNVSLKEISTPCLRGPVPSPGSSSSPGRAGSLSRGTALIPPSIPCLPANPL